MKSMISLLVVVVGVSASAQLAPSSSLNAGASNFSPVAPGFDNVFGTFFRSTNVVPANLNTGLAALQNDIQQLLPALANFNDNAALSALIGALQSSATVPTGGASVPVPLSGQNLSTRTSSDFSTLLSQDVSARVGGTPPNGSFSTAIGAPTQPALTPSPTGVNNRFGLAPGFGGPVTNAFGTVVTAQNVIRDLIVLQNDLERLLPVLVTLNGSSLPAGFTNTVGSVNNSSSSLGLATALNPTGR
jgi:hypothetical protein